MYSFGRRSSEVLETCDQRLIVVCRMAIQLLDIAALSGARTEQEQDMLYAQGRTMPGPIVTDVHYPNSKHNVGAKAGRERSAAIDIAPYPIDWGDLDRFRVLAGIIIGLGHAEGVPIRWGGDWNRNFRYGDQRSYDMPHFEIVGA